MTNITLRRAERADADAVIGLIIALAEFENLPPPDDAAPVEPLFENAPGPSIVQPSPRETRGVWLCGLVRAFVLPDTWRDGSGPPDAAAGVVSWGGRVLIVAQTPAGHRAVTAFLDQLRAAHAGQPAGVR